MYKDVADRKAHKWARSASRTFKIAEDLEGDDIRYVGGRSGLCSVPRCGVLVLPAEWPKCLRYPLNDASYQSVFIRSLSVKPQQSVRGIIHVLTISGFLSSKHNAS